MAQLTPLSTCGFRDYSFHLSPQSSVHLQAEGTAAKLQGDLIWRDDGIVIEVTEATVVLTKNNHERETRRIPMITNN